MRVLGHRILPGATRYYDAPVDYLVIRSDMDVGDAPASIAKLGASGSDLGRLIGSAACALQRAAGFEAQWHDAWQDEDGDWVIVCEFQNPHAASEASSQAVAMFKGATQEEAVQAIHAAVEENAPGPGVRSVLQLAQSRGIPTTDRGHGLWQLGWGVNQKHLWNGVPGDMSGLGHDIANDHERSKQTLEDTGVPIPYFDACSRLATTEEACEELRFPVTIKPLRGQGGVTPLVDDKADIEAAYDHAKEKHNWVVIEDHVRGVGHDILVLDGEAISAIRVDGEDVTDTLHPSVKLAAERAAKRCLVAMANVHVVATSLEEPLDETRGKVVGLNPTPPLAPHLGRGIAEKLVNRLFPEGDGRIPLVTITGTNGKTTTARLTSHILKYSGGRVGLGCTGAVEVENHVILKGDYSGPMAAQTVLREPGVTHAVCEVARGGILRRGLGYDKCDVAVFLNVGSDHLGQGGINTLDDLAHLKGVVVRSVREGGTAVLNADDDLVWSQRHLPGRHIIPISMDPENPRLAEHLKAGPENVVVTVQDGAITLKRGAASFRVADILDIPITLDGAAWFNIQNAMAAVAATYALGCTEEATRAALISFNPSMGQLPGRMNLMNLGGVKVLLDYGHNVPALQALAKALPRLAQGRKLNVANASGNRRDEDLHAFGKQIASMYDHIYLCDPDPRRRQVGETAEIVAAGIRDGGKGDALTIELDEGKALRKALADSKPGDLVVLQADDVAGAIDLCKQMQARLEAGENPADLNEELLS